MAIYPQDRSLTDAEINEWCAKIEGEYNASNVNFVKSTMVSHVFQGTVENKNIKFYLDKIEGLIITDDN